MRWYALPLAGALVAGTLSILPAAPALAASRAQGTDYSFALVPADTAVSPGGGSMAQPGDSITVRGGGTFDPSALTVHAGGTFVHYRHDGTVMCTGRWQATGFGGFTDFGPGRHGAEGGVLSIVVTHYCPAMHMTMTGIPMTVTSAVNGPAGTVTGITAGDFSQPAGGSVWLHRDR